ncbi:MAG: sigma-70 family RNA polymerase sigma factor [Gemmataceae bacterium]|nr:sigma-70 family RNA polymerase sigma factor [Gemmataceae bacterium]
MPSEPSANLRDTPAIQSSGVQAAPDWRSMHDDEILRRIIAEPGLLENATLEIQRRCEPECTTYARTLVKGDDEAAESLAKEAIQKLWVKLCEGALNGRTGEKCLRSYACVIVRNDFLADLRKRKTQREKQQVIAQEGQRIEQLRQESRQKAAVVREALEELRSEQQREIIERGLGGESLKEIAKAMGLTEHQVKYEREKGKEQMRKLMGAD